MKKEEVNIYDNKIGVRTLKATINRLRPIYFEVGCENYFKHLFFYIFIKDNGT